METFWSSVFLLQDRCSCRSASSERLASSFVGFEVNDRDGIMQALIKSTTPAGLLSLRKPNTEIQDASFLSDFGDQHWSLFDQVLNKPLELSHIHTKQHSEQLWVDQHSPISDTRLRQKIKI